MDTLKATPTKQRVALVIQYQGTHFHGWQRQPQMRTVQEELETAIAEVVKHPVRVHGAGRTDAGVHAAAQVAHFEPISSIPPSHWDKILNARLSDDILIRGAAPVSHNWHARFSASWRRYRYTIYNQEKPNLFIKPWSWHYYHALLDLRKMQEALTPLLGKHHLSAFHRAQSDRTHSWVEVQAVECYQRGPLIQIEIQANGFLYGMVRLLVGLLVEVGSGKRSPSSFTEIWRNEQREAVKYAAPAKGLCLLRVGYQDFPFPQSVWYDSQPLFVFKEIVNGKVG